MPSLVASEYPSQPLSHLSYRLPVASTGDAMIKRSGQYSLLDPVIYSRQTLILT
jgi:hypothetical protein